MKDLEEIISVAHVVFSDERDEGDIESVLNSIVSLIIQVPHTDPTIHKLVSMFCEKLVGSQMSKLALINLRV